MNMEPEQLAIIYVAKCINELQSVGLIGGADIVIPEHLNHFYNKMKSAGFTVSKEQATAIIGILRRGGLQVRDDDIEPLAVLVSNMDKIPQLNPQLRIT